MSSQGITLSGITFGPRRGISGALFLLFAILLLLAAGSPRATLATETPTGTPPPCSCSYCSPFGLCITCCGDVGQLSCAGTGVDAGGHSCNFGCRDGLYYNIGTAHCENPPSCGYGYSSFGVCCGAEGEGICVPGLGFSACGPGLVENDFFTCERPRKFGENCGPAFPCADSLTCTPVVVPPGNTPALQCLPGTGGDSLISKEACLVFYSAALAQSARDAGLTLNFGVGASLAAGVAGSAETGVVYSQDGKYGCYATFCAGIVSNVGVGATACTGFSTDWNAFAGPSFVSEEAVGEGITFQTSQGFNSRSDFPTNPNGTADCLGIGVDLVPIDVGLYECETFVRCAIGCDPPIANCQDVMVASDATSCGASASINNGSIPSDGNSPDTLTLVQDPPGPYGLGATSVTLTVTDNAGLSASCTGQVTVVDNTPPMVSGCPGPVTVNTGAGRTTCNQVASWTAPTLSDNCPGGTFHANHMPGEAFAVGDTTVTYTAIDAANNMANCSFTVHVIDNTPPVISGCPSRVTVNTGPGRTTCDQVVNWTAPSASDNCPGNSFSSNHNPGETFAVGSSSVTYTATDAASNTVSCSFGVTVVDNTPPVLTCPASQVVNATCPTGARIGSAPSATDNCRVASLVTTGFPAGGLFPIGDTMVSSTATDSASNRASCSFSIHVKGAVEQTNDLLGLVNGLSIDAKTKQKLAGNLSEVLGALALRQSGCHQFGTFVASVTSAQRRGKLTPAQAAQLLDTAKRIQGVTGCFAVSC